MESVYETEQPLEEVVEETETVEEGTGTYQELLDVLQTLIQDGNGETLASVEVPETLEPDEPLIDGSQVIGLFVMGMIAGILLIRMLLERAFV